MPDVQKISIALPGEQVAAIKAAIETGEYATTSEIVREALHDWQCKRELRGEDVKHLRQLWLEGEASGPAEEVDFSRLRKDARQQSNRAAARAAHAG